MFERLIDTRLQLVGQLALLLDGGEDGLFARDQLAKVEQLLFDGADLDLVQVAGRLFAVAGDEGDGGAFVEKLDGGHQPFHGHLERAGNVNQKIGRKSLEVHREAPDLYII